MLSPVKPGDILLGKYRIEKVLGRGGMGIVVAAHHVELGQHYAIKFLLPTGLEHQEAVARFLREARTSAVLKSEHVARVHDVGHAENGAPYMVMEYLEGRDLKAILRAEGPLRADLALTYVLQACDAVAEAHAMGIVHRDLKPANLFLAQRRNGTPCIKVLDFGISKILGTDDTSLTATNATLGSVRYMSPEQISNSKTVDTRTDIWALGATLFELLTNRSPFRGESSLEIVSRILQEEPMSVRELRPDIPEFVEFVIARCLRKRREDRFQTVDELIPLLQQAIAAVHTFNPNTAPRMAPMPSMPEQQAVTNPAAEDGATTVTFGNTNRGAQQPHKNPLLPAIAAGITVLVMGGGAWAIRAYMHSKSAVSAAATSSATTDTSTSAMPMVVTAATPSPTPLTADAGPDITGTNTTPSVDTTNGADTVKPSSASTANSNRDAEPAPTTKKKRSAL